MTKRAVTQIQKFIHFLRHDLWRIEVESNSRIHRFGVEFLRVSHLVFKGVKEDRCQLHAAALTFSTLMAMVPFLAILFSISSAIGFRLTLAKEKLIALSQSLGIEQVNEITQKAINMVEEIDKGLLGSFWAIILLYIVYRLLSGIEESFNQIWGVVSSRSMADKARNYLAVLFCVPILMITSTVISEKLTVLTAEFVWTGPYVQSVLQLAPTAIMTLAFVAIFRFLPNTKVQFRPALIGAFVSGLLSLILQKLMIKAGIGVARMNSIYGAFASIPIFLFWLQTSWMILLLGAELAFAMQNRQTYREERRAIRASTAAKIWVAFAIIQEAIRIFKSDESALNLAQFSQATNLPIRLANELVKLFIEAKLLGQLNDETPNSYVLVQDPEQINAKRIYKIVLEAGTSPEQLGLHNKEINDLLHAIDKGLSENLKQIPTKTAIA